MSRDDIEVQQNPAMLGERARRTTTLLVIKCERKDGTSATLKVRNLSATGLKGDCPDIADFGLNEDVKLLFRNVAPVAAQVIWYEGSEVGFKFHNPVDLDRISRARAMAAEPPQSPRSDAVGNWISAQTKRKEREGLTKAINGLKPV